MEHHRDRVGQPGQAIPQRPTIAGVLLERPGQTVRRFAVAHDRVDPSTPSRAMTIASSSATGGHNPNRGGVILPAALRWLWRQ